MGSAKRVIVVTTEGDFQRIAEPSGLTTPVLSDNGTKPVWIEGDDFGGGAPDTADFLVGTAQAGLSAEIVVGTTPGGDLGGTWAAPTVAKSSRDFGLTGVINPAQLTADTDNWSPTGLATANVIDVSTDAARSLSGIDAASAYDGRVLILRNVGAQQLNLLHASALSTAANRFWVPGAPTSVPMAQKSMVILTYSGGDSRWMVMPGLAFGAAAPPDIGTAAAGTASAVARRDHVHATGAGTPSTQAFGDAAAVGTGPAAAMTDHKHAMPSLGTGATNAAAGDHSHAAGDSSKASASADLAATTTTAADVTGATLSLAVGTYIVVGNFDVTRSGVTNDRAFEGVLDVGGADENDLAYWQPLGALLVRNQVLQVWRVVLGSTTTVKLQARHSGGTAGDYTVNAANTTLTAYMAGGSGALVGCHAYRTTNKAIVTATDTVVDLDGERFDTNGFHDLVTNNSRLIVPAGKDGYYHATFNCDWAAAVTGIREARLRKNVSTVNSYVGIQTVSTPTAGDGIRISVTAGPIFLAAGDYIEALVRQTSGGNLNLQAANHYGIELMLYRVGV